MTEHHSCYDGHNKNLSNLLFLSRESPTLLQYKDSGVNKEYVGSTGGVCTSSYGAFTSLDTLVAFSHSHLNTWIFLALFSLDTPQFYIQGSPMNLQHSYGRLIYTYSASKQVNKGQYLPPEQRQAAYWCLACLYSVHFCSLASASLSSH